MKKEATLTDKIQAINKATNLVGFIVDNDEDLDTNYDNAMEKLFDYKLGLKVLPLIQADALNHNGSTKHMRWTYPSGVEGWVDGELYFNKKMNRYEDTTQDVNGDVYRVIHK